MKYLFRKQCLRRLRCGFEKKNIPEKKKKKEKNNEIMKQNEVDIEPSNNGV